ncbi:hypothetical protein [Pyxidicoccus sp. MSG2]|uniref:hypothetical protein n=1 Tax=Pyxidicoccus sp. MSG2 TaxID=2996790 RepID=UPI00226EC56C|nr:hypothetical protein [Pyxidicoccus sp. MSG2]MCY1020126.1 hypothetical protein [Pyxidicoccus sp. MSG2]
MTCYAPEHATATCSSGTCDYVCNAGYARDPMMSGCVIAPRHPIAFRPGRPKAWEDTGMWDASGAWSVSPGGNVQHRVSLASGIVLVHNSADTTVQRGAGYGFRLAMAATLSEAPDGTVTLEEGDGTPRVFTRSAPGVYRAEPLDRGLLTRSGGNFILDEGGGARRTFANPRALGYVEVTQADRIGTVATFGYDTNNRLISMADFAGRAAVFQVSGGMYTRYTDAEGHAFSPVYQNGELMSVAGPALDGAVPTLSLGYNWDNSHRIMWRSGWSEASRTQFTYLSDGSLETVTFADGSMTRLDSTDNRVTMTDSLGQKSSLVFWNGAVAEEVHADGLKTQYARDARKRPIQLLDRAGHLRSVTYNDNDDVVSFRDEMNRPSTAVFDSRHNVLSSTTPDNLTSSYTYDALDQLLTATSPNGETTRYNRDSRGNLLSLVDFAGITRYQATYNPLGKPLTETGPDGRVTTYTYDAYGNWTSIARGSLTTTRVVDGFGRTLSVTNPMGETTQYQYDGLGRLKKTLLPNGGSLEQTLDFAGRVTSSVNAAGPVARSESQTYSETGAVSTRFINGSRVQLQPALMSSFMPPPPSSCAPSCGNRCGAQVSDTCGGLMDCTCAGGTVCSPQGYCVNPNR